MTIHRREFLLALPLSLTVALGGCRAPADAGDDSSGGSTHVTTGGPPEVTTSGPTEVTTGGSTTEVTTGGSTTKVTTADVTTGDVTGDVTTGGSTGEVDGCDPPDVAEIPVPELGVVEQVQFVDLDGDGDDELLAFNWVTISAVLDDGSVVKTASPCNTSGVDSIVPLHLDLDKTMDIVGIFGDSSRCIAVGLGAGDGTFVWKSMVEEVWPDDGVLPDPERGIAIDPDLDGIDVMAATDDSQVGLFSNFLPDVVMMAWTPIAAVAGGTDLAVGQLDESPEPDLLVTGSQCTALIRPGPAFGVGQLLESDAQPNETCRWLLGRFGGAIQQPISIVRESGLIEYWSGSPLAPDFLDMSGILESPILLDSGVPGDPRLLVVNDGNGWTSVLLAWRWGSFPDLCMADVEIPYGAFAAGDLDGDGVDEVAVITDWPDAGLRLFSIN